MSYADHMKPGFFFSAPNALGLLIRKHKLGGNDVAVLVTIMAHNANGQATGCTMGAKSIGAELGMSVDNARKSIKHLKRAGLLIDTGTREWLIVLDVDAMSMTDFAHKRAEFIANQSVPPKEKANQSVPPERTNRSPQTEPIGPTKTNQSVPHNQRSSQRSSQHKEPTQSALVLNPPEPKKQKPKPKADPAALEIFEYFAERTGRAGSIAFDATAKGSRKKRSTMLRDWLAIDGNDVAVAKRMVDGMVTDGWHIANGCADITYLLRGRDRFLAATATAEHVQVFDPMASHRQREKDQRLVQLEQDVTGWATAAKGAAIDRDDVPPDGHPLTPHEPLGTSMHEGVKFPRFPIAYIDLWSCTQAAYRAKLATLDDDHEFRPYVRSQIKAFAERLQPTKADIRRFQLRQKLRQQQNQGASA